MVERGRAVEEAKDECGEENSSHTLEAQPVGDEGEDDNEKINPHQQMMVVKVIMMLTNLQPTSLMAPLRNWDITVTPRPLPLTTTT